MIPPYGEAIDPFASRLGALGYSPSADSDYSISFSNGTYTIIFSTEKYYHPSISVTLVDERGEKFHFGMVREILAPAEFSKGMQELDAIKAKYFPRGASSGNASRSGGIRAYVSSVVRQVCDFLETRRSERFTEDAEFLPKYQQLERAKLRSLGLK